MQIKILTCGLKPEIAFTHISENIEDKLGKYFNKPVICKVYFEDATSFHPKALIISPVPEVTANE